MRDETMFDPRDIRDKQVEAIKYVLKHDILDAKITYRDRMRRLDYATRFIVRETPNLAVDIMLGVFPIKFLEN